MPTTQLRILRLDPISGERQPHLTVHAQRRSQGRRIKKGAVEAVLDYGRVVYTRARSSTPSVAMRSPTMPARAST